MGVGRAFGRLFRNILSVITFGLVKVSEPIESHPQIVGIRYDEVIQEKADAAKRIKNAIGGLMARQAEAEEKLKQVTAEIEELEDVKAGAQALAREQVEKMQGAGKSSDEILRDAEVVQLQAAYSDAGSTIEEKKARAKDLEDQIHSLQESVDRYVLDAQDLMREVEKLQAEKHETVASMEAARQIEQMNEAMAGISSGGADETLAELRKRRAEAEGRAKAAQAISSTDVTRQRQKLRDAARQHVHNKEFISALGLGESAAPSEEPVDAEKSEEAPSVEQPPQLPE